MYRQIEADIVCPFESCLPLKTVVVSAALPSNVTQAQLSLLNISGVVRVFKTRAGWNGENAIALTFANQQQGKTKS